MYILVDYDNLLSGNALEAKKGLLYVCDKILTMISKRIPITFNKVLVRLYGGWYMNKSQTKRCQDLHREIVKNFPVVLNYKDSSGRVHKVQIIVELAYSLLDIPSRLFHNTFRRRGISYLIKCKHPINLGCQDQKCPLIGLQQMINNVTCPKPGCNHVINHLFERDEQKLVDSMISMDLTFLGNTHSGYVVLVSSDDDFVPAIVSVLSRKKELYHIQTSNQSKPITDYIAGYTTYHQLTF